MKNNNLKLVKTGRDSNNVETEYSTNHHEILRQKVMGL